MGRLIDADKLEPTTLVERKRIFCDGRLKTTNTYTQVYSAEAVRNAHTVDAVPVVRCKDCEHYQCGVFYSEGVCKLHSEEPDPYNAGFDVVMQDDDFCSYGKRKGANDGDL